MPDRNVASYLNHHLAASVAWFSAMERLEEAEKGTPMGRALGELRAEAAADRRILEEFMARLKVSERESEKATAWVTEKLSRLVLPLKEKDEGLNVLLTLEALSLGVEGRRALWLALSTTAQDTAALEGPDYQTLIRRAEEQRARLERLRLDAASKALRQAQ